MPHYCWQYYKGDSRAESILSRYKSSNNYPVSFPKEALIECYLYYLACSLYTEHWFSTQVNFFAYFGVSGIH